MMKLKNNTVSAYLVEFEATYFFLLIINYSYKIHGCIYSETQNWVNINDLLVRWNTGMRKTALLF